MVPVAINGRWALHLPAHRAARPEWPWWEATRLAAMRAVIKPGDLVFDVGAEEGDFPALYSSWGADVVLAEPNGRVWPNIRAIYEANDLPLPVLCWPGFLGAGVNELGATVGYEGGWPASASGPVIGDHGFLNLCERPDIPVTTIDSIAALHRPDVITVDVEGAEFEVLKGAERTLTEDAPVLFVSVHPEFMAAMYDQTPLDLHCFLRDLGYRRRHLCTDHEVHELWAHPGNMPFPVGVFE